MDSQYWTGRNPRQGLYVKCELLVGQGRYRLILPKGNMACEHHQIESSCCSVAVGEIFLIPPGSEMIVTDKYVHPVRVTDSGVLKVDAKFAKQTNVLVAKTLVNMGNK